MNAENPASSSRFRSLRRYFFVFIALVTLAVLFYAEEKFRGKHAWNKYRKSAEARGVQFDFAAMIPPPVPDEQNGANTPFIQYWFPKPKADETNRWPELFGKANSRLHLPKSQQTHNQDDRRMTDFVAWQRAFAEARLPKPITRTPGWDETEGRERSPEEQRKAAAAILEELKIYEPVLAELRLASRRPHMRYPVEYKLDEPYLILLPHLAKIKGLVQELKVQASAELATGQADRAFDDVRLMFWLADSLKDEGFLIGQLVRIASQQIATQPIWEGLMEHKWSEAQLKEIQERILRVNFAESMSRSMSDERAGGIAFMQTAMKRNNLGEMLDFISTPEEPSGFEASLGNGAANKAIGWLMPHGWLYLEMLNHSLMMDDMIANGWDEPGKVFHPQTLDANEKAFTKQLRSGPVDALLHHQMLSHLLLPALTKASGRFSRAQATANQVALACALERYYKSHRAYPETLAALVPSFLPDIPNEAVSTNAMRYLRTGDGYILYSVGWDGVDDGGALVSNKNDDRPKGDWVWRMGR